MTYDRYHLFHGETKVPLADMLRAHAPEIGGTGSAGNPYRVHCHA